MKIKFLFLSSIILVTFYTVHAQRSLSQTIKSIVGRDYKEWEFFDYPLNNFGVATSFKGTKTNIAKNDFLVGTFPFFGYKTVPQSETTWMQPNEIIEVGCGSALQAMIEKNKQMFLAPSCLISNQFLE
jgi:hypothetical protein